LADRAKVLFPDEGLSAVLADSKRVAMDCTLIVRYEINSDGTQKGRREANLDPGSSFQEYFGGKNSLFPFLVRKSGRVWERRSVFRSFSQQSVRVSIGTRDPKPGN